MKGLSKILSNCFGNAEVQVTPQQRVKQEIAQYLTHPQLSMEDEPLPCWKSECVRYPVLAKVAKTFLCLCTTSVPSERVFSCGGNIVCDSRTCLKPQRVDSLVFCGTKPKVNYIVTELVSCYLLVMSCYTLYCFYFVP